MYGSLPNLALKALDLRDNPFEEWPSLEDFQNLSALESFQVTCTSIPTIPPRPFPLSNHPNLERMHTIWFSGCPLEGFLPELPNSTAVANDGMPYALARTWVINFSPDLVGGIPESWTNYAFSTLNLSGNKNISGTIPRKMFGVARYDSGLPELLAPPLRVLSFAGTSISGKMAINPNDYFSGFFYPESPDPPVSISFAYVTGIDFCSEEAVRWDFQSRVCNLTGTNAFLCSGLYPTCAVDDRVEMPATIEPSMPISPSPQGIVPKAKSCPPPPPGFACTPDGNWVSTGSVTTTTTFVVPSVDVTIQGNLSISSAPLTFVGTDHTLTIEGCLFLNNSEIVIDLSKDGYTTGKKVTLIKQADDCATALNALPLSVKQPASGCKQVKAKRDDSSTPSTLNAVFSIDNSKCKKVAWWIILLAVLGAILLIAIVLALVFTFNKKARQCIRPYSKRQRQSKANI